MTPHSRDGSAAAPASQTLSRGIRILEVLADTESPLGIDEIATHLGLHRSVAYRLIRTLEEHGLVGRDASGLLHLGARLAALAAAVARDLQSKALPELTAAANELGVTCFLAVLERDECVTLLSVEPRHGVATVAQRPGTRHPVTIGAPGKAILAQLPSSAWPSDIHPDLAREVDNASARGWAESQNEVIPSLSAVAVPLDLRSRPPAVLAAVFLANGRPEVIAQRLKQSAKAIREALDG